MPTQTSKKSYVYFPDGAIVAVRENENEPWFDVGAINSSITNTFEWTENRVETANAGALDVQVRDMQMSGGFTLINLEPEGIKILGGGTMELETVPGTTVLTIDDQIINSGWVDKASLPLKIVETGGSSLKVDTALTISSVTGSVAGILSEDDDYIIQQNANSQSGFSIILNSAGSAALDPLNDEVTIAFTSVIPVERTILKGGSSIQVLTAYGMRITHTDSNGKIRELELFSVDATSGGFQFNFKGANEDGIEEMPLTFVAKLDDTKPENQQLFKWSVDEGAM